MMLLTDPVIQAMPFEENGDPVLDLREQPDLRLDGRLADAEGMYARLREGTLNRLLEAQSSLPDGLRILVVEGFRPLSLQQTYFSDYEQVLRDLEPDWSPERVWVEASKYVSPPAVGPHCSGAAVDLTLCTADGVELDMGTAVNDSPVASNNACFTAAPDLSRQARHNRDVLVAALSATGLINYPTEWWHWSFGDRYWAASTGRAHAIYGPVADLEA